MRGIHFDHFATTRVRFFSEHHADADGHLPVPDHRPRSGRSLVGPDEQVHQQSGAGSEIRQPRSGNPGPDRDRGRNVQVGRRRTRNTQRHQHPGQEGILDSCRWSRWSGWVAHCCPLASYTKMLTSFHLILQVQNPP